jgi:hypothetical protein
MYSVLWTSSSPQLYSHSLTLLPPYYMVFVGFIMLYSIPYTWHILVLFPPPPSCWSPPQTNTLSHSHPIIIIIIILDLGSTNEWEREVFGFLILAYFIQHNYLHFHPFSCKWHNSTFLYGWIITLVIKNKLGFIRRWPTSGHSKTRHGK